MTRPAALACLGLLSLVPISAAPVRDDAQAAQAVAQAPAPAPLRVYIRAGLKTHAPGQHDYPQFLADWSKILTERGARVDGSLHAPLPQELAGVDVIVMYKGDAGEMTPEERATLEAFVKRGGGIVTFHDVLCGPDPAWFATILGAAKKHGEVNYSAGPIAYTVTDAAHPIMQGVTNFQIDDEAFFKLTTAPGLHALATAPMPSNKAEVVPQIWTYERTVDGGQPYRVFTWMQGHLYENFAHPIVQPMILRAISWAAKRPIDTLSTVRTGRGRGRGGQ